MTEPPLVSAIVPAYNCAPYLAAAIDSILAQDHPRVEAIVVDDGSTDETPRVLAAYESEPRVKILRQPNRGQAVARNRGIAASGGEFVGFCDADDLWAPAKISRQLALFAGAPEVGGVSTEMGYIDRDGGPLPAPRIRRATGRVTAAILIWSNVPFAPTLFRRRALEEVGGFDEGLDMGDDFDLLLRVSARWEFRHVEEPLYLYRQRGGGQLSDNKERRFANAFRTMRRFLDQHPGLVSAADARKAMAHTYLSRGRSRAARGLAGPALADFARCFRYRPHEIIIYKSLVRMALGWRRFGSGG